MKVGVFSWTHCICICSWIATLILCVRVRMWAGPGSSRDPCSEQYNGWKAFSEPETRAIADFILSVTSTTSSSDNRVNGLLVYISLHSYGQHLLTPWGFTRRLPPDYLELVSEDVDLSDITDDTMLLNSQQIKARTLRRPWQCIHNYYVH